ncbi:MAG: response regulator [Planctomycetaceae bacterium]|nr:response regulator [Planctomycetaceae bacterium]
MQIQNDKKFCYLSLTAEIWKSFYDQNEQELILTFLESITRLFPIAKTWYGTITDHTIHPVVHAGTAKNCIDFVQLALQPESSESFNSEFPLIKAIAKNQPVAVHYLDQQEHLVQRNQWKTFLESSKCRSMLAVPVEIHNNIEAGIVFYSCSPNPFDTSTIDYLVRSVHELTEIVSKKRRWVKEWQELKKSKELAEADALKKTRFFANMSHELRTPITAILGFMEMLLRENLAPIKNETDKINEKDGTNETKNTLTLESCLETLEHCKNIAQIIQSNAEFLLSILNDILDFSKLEADMLKVEKIMVPVQPFLRELAIFYSIQTRAKNLAFSIKPVTPLPTFVNTDPVRLKQVLMNLIGNAIKFTQQGGITISIVWVAADTKKTETSEKYQHEKKTITEGNLFFSIKDTGIGISPEILSTLFVPFQQADVATTRRFGGSGLGLVISKQLIQLLGGEIITKSREGCGSMFTVVLPQQFDNNVRFESLPTFESSLTDFKNNNSADEIPDGLNSNSDATLNSDSVSNSSPDSVAKNSSFPLAGRRILLAEDSPDSRRLFSLIIKKTGAEVVEADNGQAAVEIVMENLKKDLSFDIILMDMEMPVMDGYAATRQLRETGYTNPIVALTAHTLHEEHQKCLDAGCNDYAMKPILRDALITVILKHLTNN